MELGYWNCQGIAQPCRYLIKLANLKVDFKNFNTPEEWTETKTELSKLTAFPNLPYLKIKDDGHGNTKIITQSRAILMYLAEEANYVPKNDCLSEKTKIHIIDGVLEDCWQKVSGVFKMCSPVLTSMMHPSIKALDFDQNVKNKLHIELKLLFKQLDTFYSKNKFSAGNRENCLTFVDFKAFYLFNILRRFSQDLSEHFENVNKFFDNFLDFAGEDFKKYFDECNENLVFTFDEKYKFPWVEGAPDNFKRAI